MNKFRSIKVPGEVVGEKVIVLVDGGATHNFVDEKFVGRKKLKAEPFGGFNVVTGKNGNIVPCNKMVRKLDLRFKDYTVDDFFVFPVGGTPPLVLGVQWLWKLGDHTTNYQTLKLKFQANGRDIVLHGIKENAPEKESKIMQVSAKSMGRIIGKRDILWTAAIFTTQGNKSLGHYPQIQAVLHKHKRVFDDPSKGLPPSRGFQHVIELETGTKPIVINPYRHPKVFKDEIEKTIKELLDSGHIRPSSSLFASSVVLVKKKDGSMRMCIDYRALNKKTIKK